MAREFKFRIWTGEEMYYQDDQYLASFIRRACGRITEAEGADFGMQHESYLKFDIDHYLMQFTGLKDKNGKKIYEGDVVVYASDKPCPIVFVDGAFSFQDGPWALGDMLPENTHEVEVIGNIYENPDLLVAKS